MVQPTFGVNIPVLMFRDYSAVGVAPWAALSRLIPDPTLEESAAYQRHAPRHIREHLTLRGEVQRVLKSTAKGKNVHSYAQYIAQCLRGERGRKWSTPPLCLWSSLPLAETDDPFMRVLPMTSHVVAIDAETQVSALHRISQDPDKFGLDPAVIDEFRVPFELHWDISADDAKQIFHDRNWYGVPVSKTHALSMDQFDLATLLAQRLMTEVRVLGPEGEEVELRRFVNTTKRQLGVRSPEWITLSSLRSLVVTTLLGRPGIASTANAVSEEDLPVGVDGDEAGEEVVEILNSFFQRFADKFAERSAISTPACLTGIGVVANRVMSWSSKESQISAGEFEELLTGVVWEREVAIWDGIAGRRAPGGGITFGGGAKDSGGKVADALLSPSSDAGRQIRGLKVNQRGS